MHPSQSNIAILSISFNKWLQHEVKVYCGLLIFCFLFCFLYCWMKKFGLEEHTQFLRMPILRFFSRKITVLHTYFLLSCPEIFEDESCHLFPPGNQLSIACIPPFYTPLPPLPLKIMWSPPKKKSFKPSPPPRDTWLIPKTLFFYFSFCVDNTSRPWVVEWRKTHGCHESVYRVDRNGGLWEESGRHTKAKHSLYVHVTWLCIVSKYSATVTEQLVRKMNFLWL